MLIIPGCHGSLPERRLICLPAAQCWSSLGGLLNARLFKRVREDVTRRSDAFYSLRKSHPREQVRGRAFCVFLAVKNNQVHARLRSIIGSRYGEERAPIAVRRRHSLLADRRGRQTKLWQHPKVCPTVATAHRLQSVARGAPLRRPASDQEGTLLK